MFQFSNLLSRHDSDAHAAAPPDEKAPEDASATSLDEAGHASTIDTDQMPERARRDLDEQMRRLAELLNRVESLEFEEASSAPAEQLPVACTPDAVASVAAATPEPAGPEPENADASDAAPGASEPRDVTEMECSASGTDHSSAACEVVLSSGVFSNVADLPAEPFDPSRHRARSTPPATNPYARPNRARSSSDEQPDARATAAAHGSKLPRSCPSVTTSHRTTANVCPPVSPNTAAPGCGMVQDYRIAPSGSRRREARCSSWTPLSSTLDDGGDPGWPTSRKDESVLSGVVQTVAVGYPSESGNSSSVGVQVVVIDNAPSEYAAIEAAPRSLAASPHLPDIASEHAERTQTEVVPAEATIAPHHVDCEIILSDGVRSRPRELPETEHCSDKPAAHRVALSPPVPEAPSRAREKLKSPAERLGDVTDEQYSFPRSTAQPTLGLVQEYGASDEPPFGSATASDLQATESAEPRRPELRLRRSHRTTRHAQRAPAVTAAATAPGATESRTLSLLAVFGGLLTLAALLYIVGDLVSWF